MRGVRREETQILNVMKKLLLLLLGLVLAQCVMAQTVVVLDLPSPCSGTGVEEWESSTSALTFDVYPNPADDGVTIAVASVSGSLGKMMVEIADAQGRVVLKREFYSEHERLQALMGLETLGSGMYVVTLRSADGVASKKIMKK